jgi:putative PIN family toxin of toxin-antitoxin system
LSSGESGRRETVPVVLDTNVLLSLYVFRDSRYAAIRRALEDGRWSALTSDACFNEYRRVLAYPLFGLDSNSQTSALDSYAAIASCIAAVSAMTAPLPQCADRDDQKFLELARDGGAALLVTSDKALLRLARRERLHGLFRIVTPDMALGLIAAGDSVIVGMENGTSDANSHTR